MEPTGTPDHVELLGDEGVAALELAHAPAAAGEQRAGEHAVELAVENVVETSSSSSVVTPCRARR
jgi:hypothetical protein